MLKGLTSIWTKNGVTFGWGPTVGLVVLRNPASKAR